MKECADKKTVIIVFCSTAYKDRNWIQIRKHFEKKEMDIRVFTSINDEGENQLYKLINELSEEAREKEHEDTKEDEEESDVNRCDDILDRLANMQLPTIKCMENNYGDDDEVKPRKPRKPKYQAPEYMIIFDDLSGELKSKSLLELLKKNRHYKTKLIISSQWVHDLLPESRKQLDLFLIFKGFPEKKMELIYKDCDSGIPFETFYRIYKKSTKKPFSFMYVDTRSDEYRCNFDKQFIIPNPSDDNSDNSE
jgi:hypothetical protein